MPLRPDAIRILAVLAVLCLLVGSARPTHAQDFERVRSDAAALVSASLFRALDVKFQSGRATIQPASYSTLQAVADVLHRFPALNVEIAGHSDALGSAATNLRVSEQRAESVKAVLVERHGISPERLQTTAYGETLPVATNATAAGRALNRRVEFRIVPVEPQQSVDEDPDDIDVDSLREAIQQQVADAVESAMSETDTTRISEGETDTTRVSELERRLQERIDRLEQLIIAEEEAVEEVEATTPLPLVAPAARRTALLPFTGLYLRGDLPIVLGVRGDFPTTLIGTPRFQPEVAFGFRPDDRATILGANLVFPITLPFRPDVSPFAGAGIAFHNIEGFESVLNIVIGADYQLGLGTIFGEFMTQDFFDYNRLVVGFRQEI